jgi:hypothetical protein
VYSPANLERGLLAAARNFCEQEIDVTEEKMVTLSKIFQWYGSDFGENPQEILRSAIIIKSMMHSMLYVLSVASVFHICQKKNNKD